jgi:outer membrane protein assembly factor BamA
LSSANLRKATLSGATLSGADLREAVLSEAVLSDADLRGTGLLLETMLIGGEWVAARDGATLDVTDPATGNTERFFTDAIGGKSYAIGTVELALPLGLPREYGLTASLFTEFGTVAFVDSIDAEVRTVGTTRVGVVDDPGLRASAGLSVGWDSPFGPVQFDFSRILSKEDFDRTETFRFSTRTRF